MFISFALTALLRCAMVLLLCCGLFFVLQERLGYPSYRAGRTMTRLLGKTSDIREKYIYPLSFRLAGRYKLDEHKRRRLEMELEAIHSPHSPEVHAAGALVAGAYFAVFALLSLPLAPLLFPVLLFLAVYVYLKEMRSPKEQLGKRREKIEREIPQMVGTINSGLGHKQSVTQHLRKYREVASAEFRAELDILLTEMELSDEATGLIKFESRMNSPQVSSLVRGLQGLVRGDDMKPYFALIDHDMKDAELARLRKEALMRPKQLTAANFSLVACVIIMYMLVMGLQIFQSFGEMGM